MPFGAATTNAGTRFRLWAPDCDTVSLCLEGPRIDREIPLQRDAEGWCEAVIEDAGAGTRYRYRIDGGILVPDPASRFQPDDVHGASEVVDPATYIWQHADWRGRPWEETVLYELHVGAFTSAGTFRAAIDRLPYLASLGVTAVELMPVADFPGRWDWGYDGCYQFAPDAAYGRPEDLKALIDAAHGHGLTVFLDVVYNHFGPEGNYLHTHASRFF
ncbi:MAG: malto-oligosyltrehalose trehalohydrolase, partial [Rhodospirillales bacterium]|nr:malto-oligosyltrehalose trehalohydrolase [Rhodospirillales bacterium]